MANNNYQNLPASMMHQLQQSYADDLHRDPSAPPPHVQQYSQRPPYVQSAQLNPHVVMSQQQQYAAQIKAAQMQQQQAHVAQQRQQQEVLKAHAEIERMLAQGINPAQVNPKLTQELMELNLRQNAVEKSYQDKQRIDQLNLARTQLEAEKLEIEQRFNSLSLQGPNAHLMQQQLQYGQMPQQLQQMHSVQQPPPSGLNTDGIKLSTLSASAKEFVPGQYAAPATSLSNISGHPQNYIPAGPGEQVSLIPIQPEFATHPVIIQVDTAVVQLTSNPTKFDNVARNLTNTVSWQVKEENLMKEVVTVIFEQGVGEANFRFTGGKLCEYLAKNVQQHYNGLSFKSILLNRCRDEFDFRDQYLAMKNHSRIIGFTFFLAEVLTRLLNAAGNPIEKLQDALCKMLLIVLDLGTNESLKCAAQVLKMSGRHLDQGEGGPLEGVMGRLRDVAVGSIPNNTKHMLLSVLEFRAAKWGASEKDSSETAEKTTPAAPNGDAQPVLGTVFYSPAGGIDHIEEDTVEDSSDNDGSNALPTPQVYELDGEEGAAFEAFLKDMK